jgi:glucose/arabinose dehydrogenase
VRLAVLLLAVLVAAGCGGSTEEGGGIATAPPEGAGTVETGPVQTEPERGDGPLRLEMVVEGLDAPTHVAQPAGDERLYVVERPGTIRVVEGGELREEPFLDLTDEVQSGGEQGLLSVAFHPEYVETGLLYVNYTNREGDTRVVSFQANGDRSAVDPESARELLAVEQPYSNHNGGQLAFGPDGFLYVGMGDGGAGGDPENRAQDLASPLGSLLRREVDAEDSEWQTVAYGLRNPWRFSFDRETGDLLLADVGQGALEEVNRVPWPADELLNFGWSVYEGTERFSDRELGEGRLVEPIHVYGRDDGCSITGGFVYRGERVPAAKGRYFFGDYCSGAVWSLVPDGDGARDVRREPFDVPELSSFGEGVDGELYLVSLGGAVYRLA